jgi:hypothetical protein
MCGWKLSLYTHIGKSSLFFDKFIKTIHYPGVGDAGI